MIKNAMPMIVPAIPMLSNTFGKVTNIRPGPLPKAEASPPEKANTAGIIISPAIKAIPVSNNSICLTAVSIWTSFFMYEP